jgi:hypothetical protein
VTDLREKYQSLRKSIDALGLPWNVPPHVAWRLVAMLGDEPVAYIDAEVSGGRRAYTGTVVMFTETRVVIARMADAPEQPEPSQPATFSTTVATWRRSLLQVLDMAPDRDAWRNSDPGWLGLTIERDYPADLTVTLTYRDVGDPITLPLAGEHAGERTAALFDFLPSLLRDVAST